MVVVLRWNVFFVEVPPVDPALLLCPVSSSEALLIILCVKMAEQLVLSVENLRLHEELGGGSGI